MKALIRFILALVILSFPLRAYAHEGEAHIELSFTQARPGMTIEVRGSGFEPGDIATIMLVLLSTDRPQVLGRVVADEHGDFVQVVLLPQEAIDGSYEVRATDAHHVAMAQLDIVGSSSAIEEGGQREEEEPLLAPMPERSAQAAPTYSAAAAITPPAPLKTAPATPSPLLLSSGFALIVLIAGLGVIVRRSSR